MFDTLATAYAQGRPTYPPAVFDALADLAGRPLAGARIADVGAGTGIFSRQLRAAGAEVTAVELSEPMLRQLVADSPGVGAVLGSAHALPLRSGAVDFVTFAQAWHWVNPELAVPEVLRVLAPGGALACVWNLPVSDAPFRAGYHDRIRDLIGRDPDFGNQSTGFDQPPRIELGSAGAGLRTLAFEAPWSRTVPLEQLMVNITSRSYIGTVPPERLAAFLDAERAILLEHFPDGMVVEEYTTWLGVVRKP
ncbi:MAG: class I SAM-dependent methyltransferase [Catenulispora sp.]|nr:class I SAM-dependent methyltransferase [Catenulispora sp.]